MFLMKCRKSKPLNSFTLFICIMSLVLSFGTIHVSAAQQNTYYVDSVNGSDNNDGLTLGTAFATIEKARDTVRTVNGNMTGDIYVYIKGGQYTPVTTLTFNESDSGTNGYNVIYQAYNGESPMISGGQEVSGWTLHDANLNIYKASAGGVIETRQLYVNGKRAIRARSNGGLSNSTYNETGHTTTDTFLGTWKNINDMEMVYKSAWTNPRCGVDSITVNGSQATIVMDQPGWYYARNKGYSSAKNPWYYENAYELLDSEGEWYLDRTGAIDGNAYTFYYKPTLSEDMATAEVVAPVLEELMKVEGSHIDNPVHNIQFVGITFEHATWLRPNTTLGHPDAQNNIIREYDGSNPSKESVPQAAVTLKIAKSVLFERCTFTRLGSIGLNLFEGSQDNLVRGCEFYDISGNGIMMGHVDWNTSEYYMPSEERLLLKNNDVTNNYIHDIAVEYRSASAIGAAYPVDMDITHNVIENMPYSGIHLGWGWTAITTCTKNNSISYNYFDGITNVLPDGGAIYTLGLSSGSSSEQTIITGNYIKNQKNVYAALYQDEGSDYNYVTNNVIENAPYWVLTKQASNIYDYNYTNVSGYSNNAGSTITNTVVVTDGNWPQEALGIMDEAGLQAAYADLLPPPVTPELVSQWNFEDDYNDSVGTNHGVSFGTVFDEDSYEGTKSIQLDGIDDYMAVPNDDSINLTSDFTITAWIKPEALTTDGSYAGIVTKLTDAADKQFGLCLVDDKINFQYESGSNDYQLSSSNVLTTGEWQFIAVTVDDSLGIKLYRGSSIVGLDTAPTETSQSADPINIGRFAGIYNTNYFNGRIDDVRIYNYALSQGQIAALVPVEASPLKKEVEDMTLTNYDVENNVTFYSNGIGVKAFAGTTGQGEYTFEGDTGIYDIDVAYLAEDDGNATHRLYINNVKVDEWVAVSGDYELAIRKITNVQIANGDVIRIEGVQIAGSHARLDYIEMKPIPTRKEAEDMTLTNYTIENDAMYSNGIGVKASVSTTGQAEFVFSGETGTYNLNVAYISEDDGNATHRLYINGVEINQWTALYGNYEVSIKSINNVHISNGDTIKLEGVQTASSHARLDYIEWFVNN